MPRHFGPQDLGPGGPMQPMRGGGGLGWPFWVHIGWDLLVLALVVVGIILLLRALTRYRPSGAALAELELRYARGEITREEFFQRRADLTGRPLPPAAPTPPPAAS